MKWILSFIMAVFSFWVMYGILNLFEGLLKTDDDDDPEDPEPEPEPEDPDSVEVEPELKANTRKRVLEEIQN